VRQLAAAFMKTRRKQACALQGAKRMEAVQEKVPENTQNKEFEPDIVAFCCEF
jgi:hypothetical protein